MTLFIKDGKIVDPRYGVDTGEGTILYNGTVEQMAALGYEVYEPEEFVETEEMILQSNIDELKEQLANGDYKIIKCYEAQFMNRAMPYNVGELVSERDAIRAEINELEERLQELQAD